MGLEDYKVAEPQDVYMQRRIAQANRNGVQMSDPVIAAQVMRKAMADFDGQQTGIRPYTFRRAGDHRGLGEVM